MTESFRGRETSAKAIGQTWTFSRWTRNIFDDFADWSRTQLPDPIVLAEDAVLRLQKKQRAVHEDKKLPDEEKKFLLDAYQEQADRISKQGIELAASYLSLQCPRFRSLLGSPRGTAQLFCLQLQKHHPGTTLDTAWEIVHSLPSKECDRIMDVTAGTAPDSGGNGSAPAE